MLRRTILFVVVSTCAALTLPQAVSAAAPKCYGKKATIVGSAKADVLKGTPKADVLIGLGGNDTIKGLGGKDTICGGPGRDTILGGDGGDWMFGDAANDVLKGDAAYDWLFGGPGNDTIDGGANFDAASYFFSANGIDANLDTGTATGEGSDTLVNVEDLEGSSLDDTLTGAAGENWFYPGDGDDVVDGGGGLTDRVLYSYSSTAVTVDLNAGTVTGAGTDTLSGIEEALGSRYDDAFTGDAGPNKLIGWDGNDTITGGDGDDSLSGSAGDDRLDGGNGTDTIDGGDGTDTCLNGEDDSNCEA